jgi:hypothetical protein
MLMKWINFHLPKANISRFPQDIIQNNGQVVLNLIQYLYGQTDRIKITNPGTKQKKS